MNTPSWNPSAKSPSIKKWADSLHKEAKRVFRKDKTHGHMFFLFNDDGLVSINPIPPDPEDENDPAPVRVSIARTVIEEKLYGVILIGEAWTYYPKEKDHTAFQLLDGEMRVRDLKDEDRTEALYVRTESRDGDCVIYLDKIIRDGDAVTLGEGTKIEGEESWWFRREAQ